MKTVKTLLCIALVIALASALVACGGSGSSSGGSGATPPANQPGNVGAASPSGESAAPSGSGAPAPAQKGFVSIRIGVTGSLGRFLAGTSPSESLMGCDAIFETVFDIDPATKKHTSSILEDWYMEDDLTMIMKMKPGIYFSNGDEATAEDLVFSYQQHGERGSVILGSCRLDYDACEVRDKYTAAIKFTYPFGALPNFNNYLYDKAWAQSVGWDSQEWYQPVCSGPYYVYEYVADDHMTLRFRDDYWDKDHADYYVDEWIIKYYPDAATMFMDLELGNIAWCQVTSHDYSRSLTSPIDNVDIKPVSKGVPSQVSFDYIGCPVWNDKAVREAVAYGVDWEGMGTLDKGDLFVPLSSVVSSGSPFHIDPGKYEYDPERAIQILADAGYKPGEIKLHIYTMSTERYKNLAEGFQFYCSLIGIDVDVEFGDMSSALSRWNIHGDSDLGFYEYYLAVPSHDPLYPFNAMTTDSGFAWQIIPDSVYPNFQKMLIDAIYCSDPDLQGQRYKELQQIIFDEILTIPYAQAAEAFGYRTDVFTADQMERYVKTSTYLWLSSLGCADAWR